MLKARLDALLAWMRAESPEPFEARAYVDTGPVQERVYAQYAGLGWIGKNTCLINPELGSWLFLGEIICTLPLEPDTQGLEQCGSCTRCLEACPTGALVEPGVLDSNALPVVPDDRAARRHSRRASRGARHARLRLRHLPGGLSVQPGRAPRSGDARMAAASRARPAAPRRAVARPDAELRRLLKGSAMTRAKVTGLRRNLAVALGNSGDAEAHRRARRAQRRPAVAGDAMVREHVAVGIEHRRERLERLTVDPSDHDRPTMSAGTAPILLLSMPQMADPNFAQTVVLLCDYTEQGAFGLVVNRQMDEPAWTMVKTEPPVRVDPELRLWVGGPVDPQQTWVLMSEAQGPDDEQREICPGRAAVGVARADAAAAAGAALEPRARRRRLRRLGPGPARQGDRRVGLADAWTSIRADLRRAAGADVGDGDPPARHRPGQLQTSSGVH